MKSKLLNRTGDTRIYALVLDPGEEAYASIGIFAAREQVTAASVAAIGAFSSATIGWFDFNSHNYKRIHIDEQCEVLSALGDIAQDNSSKPSVHLHAVLGLSDGSTRGGHFLEGIVRPTLEVIITEMPAHLRRHRRPELGIALLDP